ncbi:MAG: hypothetical protein AAGC68_09375 [Verrucomicrobiota bacterium]
MVRILHGLAAIVLLLSSAPMEAVEAPGKWSARSAVALVKELKVESGWKVVGVTGFFARSKATQWLVLLTRDDRYEEFAVTKDGIRSSRSLLRPPAEDWPSLPLLLDKVEVDSDQLSGILSLQLGSVWQEVENYHCQLRVSQSGEGPTWIVRLHSRKQIPIATARISARSGDLVRMEIDPGFRSSRQSKVDGS